MEVRKQLGEMFGALALVVPALSILFNVGYFEKVGLQFIPLFSLTEHLVFSMQGLPLAIVLFLICGAISAIGLYVKAKRDKGEQWFGTILLFGILLVLVIIVDYYWGPVRTVEVQYPPSEGVDLSLKLGEVGGVITIAILYTAVVFFSGTSATKFHLVSLLLMVLLVTVNAGGGTATRNLRDAREGQSPSAVVDDMIDLHLVRYGAESCILRARTGELVVLPTASIKKIVSRFRN